MDQGVHGGPGPDQTEGSVEGGVGAAASPDPGAATSDAAPTELEAHAADVMRAAEEAAAATGRAMVAEARGVRRRMLEDAERRRRELIAELERVRTMLDAAIAALRAEAPADGASDPTPDASSAAPAEGGEQVGALFAQLRSEPPVPPPAPRPKRSPRAAEPGPEPDPEPTSGPQPAPVEAASAAPETALVDDGTHEDVDVPADPDAALRRRRAAVLEPLVPIVVRGSKRLLQDEQNTLLDAVRRARGRHEASRLLPDPEHQRDAWVEVIGPGVDGAYLGGRAAVGKTGRVTKAPARVVAELVAVVVKPLRERLAVTIDSVVGDGPYESPVELQRVIGSAIGARYREWKGGDLETHVVDVLCAAYARGSFDGAGPAAPLRWVPDEPGRCPDCDDNALEPTSKGGVFPTGQTHPPAHPGCRCLVVLAGDAAAETPRT
jgi:hypothetical protein